MIQQEGDLFSKISKKLKDEELRKVYVRELCVCVRARACACACACACVCVCVCV